MQCATIVASIDTHPATALALAPVTVTVLLVLTMLTVAMVQQHPIHMGQVDTQRDCMAVASCILCRSSRLAGVYVGVAAIEDGTATTNTQHSTAQYSTMLLYRSVASNFEKKIIIENYTGRLISLT